MDFWDARILAGGPPAFLIGELCRLRQISSGSMPRLRAKLSQSSSSARLLQFLDGIVTEFAPNCTAGDACLPHNACTCAAQSTQAKNTTAQPKPVLKNSGFDPKIVVQTPSAANLPLPAQVSKRRKRSQSPCARCEHDAGPPKRGRKPAHTCGAGVALQPANNEKLCGLLPLNPIQRIQGTVAKPGLQIPAALVTSTLV